jgi:hypothetical protein
MRFGGHDSFGVRDGWLFKGTDAVATKPGLFFEETLADELGVGRNMAKSIRFWMSALGLMDVSSVKGEAKTPTLSRFCQVLIERDPYLVKQSSIWMMHCIFLNDSEQAIIWKWFFQHFSLRNFTKAECEDAASVFFATRGGGRPPTADSLTRDLSCLLGMYSTEIPEKIDDPEDNHVSPFSRLGIISHLKSAHLFRLNDGTKKIPVCVFGFAAQLFANKITQAAQIEISFKDLLTAVGSPGRTLVLSSEALLTLLTQLEQEYPKVFRVVGHAGDRYLNVKVQDPLSWIENSISKTECTEELQ